MELGAQGAHLRTQYLSLYYVKCRFCAPNILALFYELRTQNWTASATPAALNDDDEEGEKAIPKAASKSRSQKVYYRQVIYYLAGELPMLKMSFCEK